MGRDLLIVGYAPFGRMSPLVLINPTYLQLGVTTYLVKGDDVKAQLEDVVRYVCMVHA